MITLVDVLDEIEIGFNNLDSDSRKLRGYADEIRELLKRQGAVLENISLHIRKDGDELDGGRVFFQGSYATHTAIKYKDGEVDADLAFIADRKLDNTSRGRILNTLTPYCINKGYIIDKRKNCISIDFNDGYLVDLAVYSKEHDGAYHLNSSEGYESKKIAFPKELIDDFNSFFVSYPKMRKVIRLSKYFIKQSNKSLEIPKEDRIPSIALSLYAMRHYDKCEILENELDLETSLNDFIQSFSEYLIEVNFSGPCYEALAIGNTLYKVKNNENVSKLLNYVEHALENRNYGLVTSRSVLETISLRKNAVKTPAFTGTMGNE